MAVSSSKAYSGSFALAAPSYCQPRRREVIGIHMRPDGEITQLHCRIAAVTGNACLFILIAIMNTVFRQFGWIDVRAAGEGPRDPSERPAGVEPGGLARQVVPLGEVGCLVGRLGVQPGRRRQVTVALVQVRRHRGVAGQ